MTGELIRIINYDPPRRRRPRRRVLHEMWTRARAHASRLVHRHPKTAPTARVRGSARL